MSIGNLSTDVCGDVLEEYHLLQNDYSFDALQFDCFRINMLQ